MKVAQKRLYMIIHTQKRLYMIYWMTVQLTDCLIKYLIDLLILWQIRLCRDWWVGSLSLTDWCQWMDHWTAGWVNALVIGLVHGLLDFWMGYWFKGWGNGLLDGLLDWWTGYWISWLVGLLWQVLSVQCAPSPFQRMMWSATWSCAWPSPGSTIMVSGHT